MRREVPEPGRADISSVLTPQRDAVKKTKQYFLKVVYLGSLNTRVKNVKICSIENVLKLVLLLFFNNKKVSKLDK
jgi:hypothetical protein